MTAHELSKKGARIIMLCRNVAGAEKVAEEIRKDTGCQVCKVLGNCQTISFD